MLTSEIAYYYVKGTSGVLHLTCEVKGDPDKVGKEPVVEVYGGKNISSLSSFTLRTGAQSDNWKFTESKEDGANVKVTYGHGENLSVRCYGNVTQN